MTLVLGCVSTLVLALLSVSTAPASANSARTRTLSARQMTAIRALIHAHSHGIRRHGYLISPRAHSAIVGGTDAAQGTWGFMAFVAHFDSSDSPDFYCSGTLISPTVVLTAAHCVTDEDTGKALKPSSFQVVTGTVDISDPSKRRVSDVGQVVVHPQFDPSVFAGDAAMLVLATPTTAPTVRVASTHESAPYTPGTDALIAGWGIPYAGGDASSLLQAAPTNVQGSSYCSRFNTWYREDWETCAVQSPGYSTGTCDGDSGGPLLVHGTDGSTVEIGVTSTGPANCNVKTADYFTRTDVIASWVAQHGVSVGSTTSSSTTSTRTGSTSTTTTTKTTTATATTTTTTITTTTATTTTAKPPVVKVTLPTLTIANARSYAATMVRDRTHNRPRLALSCRPINEWSVHCSIRWQSAGSSYSLSGRFYDYLQGTRAFWWYDFTGTRRWTTCQIRHHRRACTAYVQRFRWA